VDKELIRTLKEAAQTTEDKRKLRRLLAGAKRANIAKVKKKRSATRKLKSAVKKLLGS